MDQTEERLEQIERKYKGKILTPRQILNFRNELVEKHGNKIIPGMHKKLTEVETFAQKEYEILSEQLYKIAPDVKKADKMELDAVKVQDFYGKIFGIFKSPIAAVLNLLM